MAALGAVVGGPAGALLTPLAGFVVRNFLPRPWLKFIWHVRSIVVGTALIVLIPFFMDAIYMIFHFDAKCASIISVDVPAINVSGDCTLKRWHATFMWIVYVAWTFVLTCSDSRMDIFVSLTSHQRDSATISSFVVFLFSVITLYFGLLVSVDSLSFPGFVITWTLLFFAFLNATRTVVYCMDRDFLKKGGGRV